MKKKYMIPDVRVVAMIPERIYALSTPNAYDDEDEDERAPQSSRGFFWENDHDDPSKNFWN